MDVYERLNEAVRHLEEYRTLQRRLKSARGMVGSAHKNLRELEKLMQAEGRDLKRLDDATLTSLWHRLRGTMDESRRKEEMEYLQAKLKYEEAAFQFAVLERQVAGLESELARFSEPEHEYQLALAAKEEYLVKNGGSNSEHIFKLIENLALLQARICELEEAIEAGQMALQQLNKTEKLWGSAQGWGAADILGGGLLVTAVKHLRINDARKEFELTRDFLIRFHRELQDVNSDILPENNNISFAADFLLDGILFDLIVQSQINRAIKRTRRIREQIEQAVSQLQESRRAAEERHNKLMAEKISAIQDY